MKDRLMPGAAAVVCLPSMRQVEAWKPKSDEERRQIPEIREKVRRCQAYAAYVWDQKPPIYLCSPFFSMNREQQIRTLVHESAHLAKVGSPEEEAYCQTQAASAGGADPVFQGEFRCQAACERPDINLADNWSQWVFCTWLGSDAARNAGAHPD